MSRLDICGELVRNRPRVRAGGKGRGAVRGPLVRARASVRVRSRKDAEASGV